MQPRARPDLAARFPLILTSAKSALFCQTRHRALPSLRKRAPPPEVELYPTAAQARGIANGDWVSIETPQGSVRACDRLNDQLDPPGRGGTHGWWQACAEIGAPGYDPSTIALPTPRAAPPWTSSWLVSTGQKAPKLQRVIPLVVSIPSLILGVVKGILSPRFCNSMPSGKERTKQEFATLLHSAGLTLEQITPINGSFFSVVEATSA
jgi:hypothetical protein